MPETQPTSHEDVPHETYAHPDAHPDRLAVVSTLFGMSPAAVERCRVLELACANGGHLIPMALELPQARLLGVDSSPQPVTDGNALIDRFGLTNVELRATPLETVGDEIGEFDYIIAHGIYSWVSPASQETLLDLLRRHLAPDGVAYVSYNTYPGWHARGMVREMMAYHVAEIADPRQRARDARAFLGRITASLPEPEGVHALTLAQELGRLQTETDAQLLRDHLEEENNPVYYHEFAAQAKAHGLQIIGDARYRTASENQPPPLREAIEAFSSDPVAREQYADFLRNRTFRRTLLCRSDVSLTRPATPDAVMRLRASAKVAPLSPQPDIFGGGMEEFRGLEGPAAGASNDPLIKTMLLVLIEHWPHSVPFEDLHRMILGRLFLAPDPKAAAPFDSNPKSLAEALLQCYGSGFAEMHAYEPAFVTDISEHPTASPLARLQAESGHRVTSLQHRIVELSDFDRLVLRQLDGGRDWFAILDALDEAVSSGAFTIQQDGQPLKDTLKVRQILGKSIDPSLRRLALSALLVG